MWPGGSHTQLFPKVPLNFYTTSSWDLSTLWNPVWETTCILEPIALKDPMGSDLGAAVNIQLWYGSVGREGRGSVPTQSRDHCLLLWQAVGTCVCHIGSIYILGPHLTKDFSQGTEPSMDKLAPRRNMRNVISKIQQYDFLTSLRDSRMGLWLMADSSSEQSDLLLVNE